MLPRHDTTEQLLSHLRALPKDNPQLLIAAYTQALTHLGDDAFSFEIFRDYVKIACVYGETEEVGHIYNLMKVKMRAYRDYWLGYLKFEVVYRGKSYDYVFGKMMDYLRVKVFSGKDALVDELVRDKESIRIKYNEDGKDDNMKVVENKEDYNNNRAYPYVNDMMIEPNDSFVDISDNNDVTFITKKLKDLSSISSLVHTGEMFRDGLLLEDSPGVEEDMNGRLGIENGVEEDMNGRLGIENGVEEDKVQESNKENANNGNVFELTISIDKDDSVGNENINGNKIHTAADTNNASTANAAPVNHSSFECDVLEQTFNRNLSTIIFKNREAVKISRIGRGGYSAVYKILIEKEIYALKQIQLEDKEGMKISMDEIAMLKKLNDNLFIIKLIDYDIKKDRVDILLEYGEIDLERIITSNTMNLLYIKYIWDSILNILLFIHQRRIIHRDIKPANFVLVKGKLKLIDFGISKNMRGDTTSVLNVEKAGTLNYISPEQCTGGRVSRASDVWSAGCILYYMIYRKHIHPTKDAMGILRCMSEERAVDYGPADPLAVESIKLCLRYDSKTRAKVVELLNHKFLK
ncbi:serine/threonine-protein kinase TTK/MPS1 [Pancytospora epiphaga]|nr:serine/threonine-protein kinase TTK/MPS1 [Pancytospora epiphaga]